MIGITTFNRKNILVKMAKSFSECAILDGSKIIIFDDHSSEYGKDFLSKLFPNAQIFINECSIGADNNIYAIYQYFLKTDRNILFSIDSDLIFNPDFINIGIKYIDNTDGILSLYNSLKHKYYKKISIGQETFLLKRTIGTAGTVFTKKILKKIIENVPCTRQFDWDYSYYLNNIGIKIFVTEKSYVQHIGFHGFNTQNALFMDYGLNFDPITITNYNYLLELLESVIIQGDIALSQTTERLNESYWIKKKSIPGYIIKFLLEIKNKIT